MSEQCPRCGAPPPHSQIGCGRCGLPFSVPAAVHQPPARQPQYAALPGFEAPPAYAPPPPAYGYGYAHGPGYAQQAAYSPWPQLPPSAYQVLPPRDRGMEALLPVNRSGLSILAGYLGLCSILVLPGPFALACGVLALNDLRDKPHVGGRGRAIFGIVAGGFATLGLIGMLTGS